jgi:hypothetical protein
MRKLEIRTMATNPKATPVLLRDTGKSLKVKTHVKGGSYGVHFPKNI